MSESREPVNGPAATGKSIAVALSENARVKASAVGILAVIMAHTIQFHPEPQCDEWWIYARLGVGSESGQGSHCARQNCCAPEMLFVKFCVKPESVLVAAEIQPTFKLVEDCKT